MGQDVNCGVLWSRICIKDTTWRRRDEEEMDKDQKKEKEEGGPEERGVEIEGVGRRWRSRRERRLERKGVSTLG